MIDTINELPPQAGENPKPRKTGFDTKVKAISAAVAGIGPHAVNGFEFEVFKLDGRWHWRAFDMPKAPDAAQLKARGGKRSLITPEADQARHEERGAERAAGEGRLRPVDKSPPNSGVVAQGAPQPTSLVDMAKQISGGMAVTVSVTDDFASLTRTPAENFAAEVAAKAKPDTTPDPKTGLPAFLDRSKTMTAEEIAASKKRVASMIAQTTTGERKIKNPPDADAARRRAERDEAKMAKVEGTPAHAKAVRAAKKAKAAKETAPRAKAATGARKAVATPSGGKTKTAVVGELLSRKEGCTTADILKATGWPAVSVPAQAKAVGLKLRKEKDGKVTRYYGSKA